MGTQKSGGNYINGGIVHAKKNWKLSKHPKAHFVLNEINFSIARSLKTAIWDLLARFYLNGNSDGKSEGKKSLRGSRWIDYLCAEGQFGHKYQKP